MANEFRIVRDDMKTMTPFTKTFVLPDDISEHDVLQITPPSPHPSRVEIHLDLTLLTQPCKIWLKERTNGTDDRPVNPEVNWVPGMLPNVMLGPITSHQIIFVTITSGTAEGATRDIPVVAVDEGDIPASYV